MALKPRRTLEVRRVAKREAKNLPNPLLLPRKMNSTRSRKPLKKTLRRPRL